MFYRVMNRVFYVCLFAAYAFDSEVTYEDTKFMLLVNIVFFIGEHVFTNDRR